MENRDGDGINVLLVDDDREFAELVADFLAPHGYQVTAVHAGQAGLDALSKGQFEVVILDVMMPGMDGFEVLKTLRKTSTVPVLMLTSRGDEIDRIVGLEIGADDYIPKTYSARELLARLRAVLRRVTQPTPAVAGMGEMNIGALRMNQSARRVELDGEEILLTKLEFDLLAMLMDARGRVLSRDYLFEEIAGREYTWEDRAFDIHVSSLRRKLRDDPRKPRFIKTVRGIGYMFMDGTEE